MQLYLNGHLYRFTGINVYNANSRSNCSYSLGNNDGELGYQLGQSGVQAFRAWFFQKLSTTNGVRDWSAFDHTLAVAHQLGVKVIVTLMNQWASCDSGLYRSASWYAGGYLQPYGSEIEDYRDYVRDIVTRYKNETAILAWQIGNEIEIKNTDGTCGSPVTLDTFVDDVAGLIKSIDPNHLVSVGTMGSNQCGAQGSAQYQALHASPNVDLCEYHDYGYPSTPLPTILQTRINDCEVLNKPLFVGEAGIKATDTGRATEFDNKITMQFGSGAIGFMPWSWNENPDPTSYEIGPGDPVLATLAAHDGYH